MTKYVLFLFAVLPAVSQDQWSEIIEGNIFKEDRVVANQEAPVPKRQLGKGFKLTDANLHYAMVISNAGQDTGLAINSISNRKARVLEEDGARLVRVYCGFDGDLTQLMAFFGELQKKEPIMGLEGMTVSARPKRLKPGSMSKRSPLNGNFILTFPANDDDAALLKKSMPQMAEKQIIGRLFLGLTRNLPADAHLTSLIVKKGTEVSLMGLSDDFAKSGEHLSNAPFLSDLRPANAVTGKRFFFKADLDMTALPTL